MAIVAMGETEPVSTSIDYFIFGRPKTFNIEVSPVPRAFGMRALYKLFGAIPTAYDFWASTGEPDLAAIGAHYPASELDDIGVIKGCQWAIIPLPKEEGPHVEYLWDDLYTWLLTQPVGTKGELRNSSGGLIMTARNYDGSNITILDEGPVDFSQVTESNPEIDLADSDQYKLYFGSSATWGEGGLLYEVGNLYVGGGSHRGLFKFMGQCEERPINVSYTFKVNMIDPVANDPWVACGAVTEASFLYGYTVKYDVDATYWLPGIVRMPLTGGGNISTSISVLSRFAEAPYGVGSLSEMRVDGAELQRTGSPNDFGGGGIIATSIPGQTLEGRPYAITIGMPLATNFRNGIAMAAGSASASMRVVLLSYKIKSIDSIV